jgi:hypothetical protein
VSIRIGKPPGERSRATHSGRPLALTIVHVAIRLLAQLREDILRPVPVSLAGVDTVLAKLNRTIDNLVERRDMLTGYRERLTRPPAVHSLPDDILISVFQICIWSPYDMSVAFHHMSSIRAPYFRFFSFSWVCRAWRCLAMNTPILWKDLIMTNPVITAAMLERAKDTLIRVFLDLNSSGRFSDLRSKQEAISSVLQRTPQISDLSIFGSQNSTAEILGILCILNQREPRCLRTLNIYMPERSSLSLEPSHMNHFSALSTLSLVRCSPSWNSLAPGRLAQLHLNGEWASGHGGSHYPLAFLMQTLAHMPQLTEVTLYSCIRKNPFPSHLGDPVRLPSLRSLSINDDMRICLAVLQSITGCLSLMQLSIGDNAEDIGPVQSPRSDVLRALFPQIRQLYASSNTCPRSFQSLDIGDPSFEDYLLRICGSWRQFGDKRASSGYLDSDDGLSFWLKNPTSVELMTAVELAVTSLPLTRIDCLHATPSATFRCRSVLALASLTRIVVTDSACRQFIASWCSPTHAAGGPVTQFPALECLLFRKCDVYLRPPLTDTRSELQSLVDTVRSYSTEGRPLKQLTFISCFFESKDNDVYRPIVDEGIIRERFKPFVTLLEVRGIRSLPLH